MKNSQRLISAIEKCSTTYQFEIKEVKLELSSLDRRDSVRWEVSGKGLSVEDRFYINGLFQGLRLKRIAEQTKQYFASRGIDAYTCSSTSCDDSF
jgi:hypothetical protein